jgi:hypothetical protein
MSTKQTETIQPTAPHSLNEKEVLYIQSMTSQEKQLHELATKMLGTSYFVGKTHGFTKWLKAQQQQAK